MTGTDSTPGTTIRRLVRTVSRASLASLAPDGSPYVSLVMIAANHDGTPLLLLSDLAEHTANLARDPRAALLFDGTVGMAVALAGERATLTGRIEWADEPHGLQRYLAQHDDARQYATFADFKLYRLAVERAHLVAGFGRIQWADAADVILLLPRPLPLAEDEAAVVRHMNEDHADAVRLYAERLIGQPAADWRMTGVDPEGADLAAGRLSARLWFDRPVTDAEGARIELVRLVRRARQATDPVDRGGE